MTDIISVVIALILAAVAAVQDLKTFRISNRLIVIGVLTGICTIIMRVFTGGHIGSYILGTLAGLAGMMLLYIMKAVGAGDVKLFAVLGLFIGLELVVQLMIVSLITGLLTGIVELCLKKTKEVSMGSSGIKTHGFHYAAGILIGYVVVLVYRIVVFL